MVARAGRVTARLKTIDRQAGGVSLRDVQLPFQEARATFSTPQAAFVREAFLEQFLYVPLRGKRLQVSSFTCRSATKNRRSCCAWYTVVSSGFHFWFRRECRIQWGVKCKVWYKAFFCIMLSKQYHCFAYDYHYYYFFFHFIWGRFLSCTVIDTWTFSSSYVLFNFDVAPF